MLCFDFTLIIHNYLTDLLFPPSLSSRYVFSQEGMNFFSTDAKHTKLLLLLDSALNVHVFPRTAEAVEIISKAASSIFFFLADKENGALKGYMLLSEADRSSFPVQEMWNVKMPSSQQTITNIGTNTFVAGV